MTGDRQYPLAVAVGAGALWSVGIQGTISRIDAFRKSVVARIPTAPTADRPSPLGGDPSQPRGKKR